MTERTDVIVVGAGHNGLVCAAYLARAGMKVLVLEAADSPGGMCAPRTILDGYRLPGLAHVAHPLAPTIRRDLGLTQFGYEPGPAIDTVALDAGGKHLTVSADGVSGDDLPASDGPAYAAFREQYLAFAKALRPLFDTRPPRLKDMEPGDKLTLAKLGWNVRLGLGREAMYELLRVAAINIYDVLNDTLEDERLKGAIAVDAILGSAMGPRTPGTVLTWLQRLQGELNGPLAALPCGTTHLADALIRSAEDAGVTIRCNARVGRILVENHKASGVELSSGEIVSAGAVISSADPRSTFLELVGMPLLDTMFANRVTQIRGAGVVAKLHLALNGLPEFAGLPASHLSHRLLVAPSMRYIERAFNHSKYGQYSDHPVLDITIPSLHDSTLAPEGHHVMSINVAYAPYELDAGWENEKAPFTAGIISQLAEYSPTLPSLIVGHETLTPRDIEEQFGNLQGHWHHAELSIHQSFMMRPLYGAAQYDTPVEGLFLCGAGSHPGGGLTGQPGRSAAKRVLQLGGTT